MYFLKKAQVIVLALSMSMNVMANNLKFELQAKSLYSIEKKCFSTWMGKDSHITTQITATQVPGQKASFEIYDLSQHNNRYASKEGFEKSKVVFTPTEDTDVNFCFWVTLDNDLTPSPTHVSTISLEIQIGKTIDEFNKLAKAEKIKPQELELLRLEQRFKYIVQVYDTFNSRDLDKMASHESLKINLANFSFFSMALLIVAGIWQIAYLRSFFKTKRLI